VQFSYSLHMQETFPDRVTGILAVDNVGGLGPCPAAIGDFERRATQRLASRTEGEFPEIQAWRRAFSQMGLKPTQYRCAAEALLRRFRKSGSLPNLHPLVDLCNAASMAFATPVAVFDRARLEGALEVRQATGTEPYLTFSGETETPGRGEIIFADTGHRAHARRWANKQSLHSIVSETTEQALIVAEALHATAAEDMSDLVSCLAQVLEASLGVRPDTGVLRSPDAVWSSGYRQGA